MEVVSCQSPRAIYTWQFSFFQGLIVLTGGAMWICLDVCGLLWEKMVNPLLTGNFVRSLDDKQRFAIPRPLRGALGFPNNTIMYLAPGTDGSLALYTEKEFAALASQLDRGSPTRSDVRAFSRMFYAQAQRVEADRQGRVRIPPELHTLAGLSKEVVLLGVRDHIEIWDRQRWSEYLEVKQTQYDEIAETAFSENLTSQRMETKPASEPQSETDSLPAQPR